MKNTNTILEHATQQLESKVGLEKIRFKHLFDRYFSVVYEVNAEVQEKKATFILKISTTSRSCISEFEKYEYLYKVGVRSLVPVLYSNEFNYLITEKAELVNLDTYLKNTISKKQRLNCFYGLGVFIRSLEEKTGYDSYFDKSEFDGYVIPRINELSVFSSSEKIRIANYVQDASSRISKRRITACFVSDLSFGNINYDNNGEILLLDMGDACFGNCYDNIAFLQLEINFGVLNKFVAIGNSHKSHFSELLRGANMLSIDESMLTLYKIKHLINMISFTASHPSNSSSECRRKISNYSNLYLIMRYKRYLQNLLRNS